MTTTSLILLLFISLYALYFFFSTYSDSRKIFHFCLGMTALSLFVMSLSSVLKPSFEEILIYDIENWSVVFILSFLLSAVAALIRDSKPVFARFPRFFTFIPLILIVVYPLVSDSSVLKEWVFSIYILSSLLIGLLIYGYRSYHNGEYALLLAGIGYFLTLYLLSWLPAGVFSIPDYSWTLFLSAGIILIVIAFKQLIKKKVESASPPGDPKEWFV